MIALPVDAGRAGTVLLTAQERVLFGKPAAQAVCAEVERLGAQRVFVTSGASLARLSDGPLQRIEAALGPRLAGRFVGIRAHSPRDDVIAAARAARDAQADLLVAVGGGSVIDATKAVQFCIWMGLDDVQALEPYRWRDSGALRAIQPGTAPLSEPSIACHMPSCACWRGAIAAGSRWIAGSACASSARPSSECTSLTACALGEQ